MIRYDTIVFIDAQFLSKRLRTGSLKIIGKMVILVDGRDRHFPLSLNIYFSGFLETID